MRFLRFLVLLLPLAAAASPANDDAARLKSETFQGLELRSLGPAFMSGRISDVVIHPRLPGTWYVAVGSGGVWKTTNAGTTWKPIFDEEGSYSIGCVTLDPSNSEVVWVGTGENVGGRHVGYGEGVYLSRDGGGHWTNVGLRESEHIGQIVVDPSDSRTVYVAAQGPLWSAGGDRGLFKTTDEGATWRKILGGGPYTGVNEVAMDPRDARVLYASTHQRFRNVAALINGGPESGIHKSTDGGETWRELAKGLPDEESEHGPDMGKIGLAISPQRPDVVYATIEQGRGKGNFYRSTNGGESWEKRADYISGGTGPHYYQEIFASPHAFDRVYQMDVRLHVTEDGGETFVRVPHESKHSDNHAMAFRADDPDYLLVGSDGGLYESWDLGEHWKFVSNLPVTQFYKVAVDYDEPFYNVYGGTQDNSTQGGPSRTVNANGILNEDWFIALGGDGHQPAVDPTNPDLIYCEWQRGNLSRYDRKTGEIVYIQPQPDRGEPTDRFNWDSPILISPHDPARLFFASQRVWRSDDRGDAWRPISGDLTRNLERMELPMMERVWSYDAMWDLAAMSEYGTVTSLSESPLVEGLIYAGTDDGLIQVTEDGGSSWRSRDTLPGVSEFFFVNDIKADLHDENAAYVVVDLHKEGDFAPYVLKTTDRGRSWKSIAGDLPERHVVWRLVQDHVDPDLLFVGTEFGVFFTVDGGSHWVELTGGVPNIPFRDLAIQKRENDLVGATFGRGFYVLDDYTALRDLSEDALAREAAIFPVRDAWWYLERRPLGGSGKASQGDAFFRAENPPFGAVFTYYLREELRTRRDTRHEREKKIAAKAGDTPFPGWDEILREENEEEPSVLLIVRDDAGEVVRRITGPVKAGFHRVAWDLRYPSPRSWAKDDENRWPEYTRGLLAPPGRYEVTLAKRVDGQLTELGTQEFRVIPLGDGGTLPGATPDVLAAYTSELDELRRDVAAAASAIQETIVRLDGIQEALLRSTAHPEVEDIARDLDRQLDDLRLRLEGSKSRRERQDPGPVPVTRRLGVAVDGCLFSTYGPTATHRKSLDIAHEDFAAIRRELDDLIHRALPELERRLDKSGVPWTPGRAVGG